MGSDYPLYPPIQPSASGSGGAPGGRMLLATALCLGVMFASMHLLPKAPPLPASPLPLPVAPTAVSGEALRMAPVPVAEAWAAELGAGSLLAGLTNDGAGILRLTCLRDPAASLLSPAEVTFTSDASAPALLAVAASDLAWSARWARVDSDAASARFTTALPNGVVLVKTLRIPPSGYVLEMELEASNPGSAPAEADLRVLVPAPLETAGSGPHAGPAAVLTALLERPDFPLKDGPSDPAKAWGVTDPLPVRWAGVKGGYVAVLARPVEAVPASALSAEAGLPRVCAAIGLGPWPLAPGESRKARVLCYAGPLKDTVLAASDPALPQLLKLGFISTPLKAILDFFHRLSANYGLAIILLTLLVRVVIHPLNRMSQISMLTTSEKMKRLQPRLDEAKKRHKKDARKLMEEQTRIMKEEGMTPFSPMLGCLPMILQLPVLWALYHVLQGSIELRGAPFVLWIRDLSVPDSVLTGIPLLGTLNPLPIALIGVTVWQMWRAPKPADPQMAQQQKMMMFIMPVMFGFMFYQMPAGITLYWFTSTAFSIGEQAWIRRILAKRGIGTGR